MKLNNEIIRQLLIDGKYDLFEEELSKLEFEELIKFSYNKYESSNKKEKFSEDYYGVKILGEMMYLITTKNLVVLSKSDFDIEEFKKMILSGLACNK